MKTTSIFLFISLGLLLTGSLWSADEPAAETTLHGYFLKRPDNTYLHVEMVGNRMIFKLLDEDYMPIENVFTRGIMTVDPKGRDKERVAIRSTGDGMSLHGVQPIRKPHLLQVFSRLYKGESDSSGESFSFFYNQHTIEEVTVTPPKE